MYTLVILYTELMPYNLVVLKELVKRDCRICVICYDTSRKTSYSAPTLPGITYYKRSAFRNQAQLYTFIEQLHPHLIWTAGWIDPLYNRVCGMIRQKRAIPVIAGSDTQWSGGKQWLNVLAARFRHQQWFSHICIAGYLQYKYAHRLGFDADHILMPNFSADLELFFESDLTAKSLNYPKRLLYMGRFSPEKGLLPLLKAWQSLPDRKGWRLTLIGDGPQRSEMNGYADVDILPYMSQAELREQVSLSGGYVLPSVFEPWALVLHEAAAAGLPILASNRCGAVPHFVEEGVNGFLFEPGDVAAIRASIEQFVGLDANRLICMGQNSQELAVSITPRKVADAILGTLKKI